MAEVKNSFLASKMNQDLDDRLVPQNEYRRASNISIVSSNNSNNGVIQNITGNKIIVNFPNYDGLEVIGQIVDEVNNIIYLFITNYTDISFNGLNNPMPLQDSAFFQNASYFAAIIRVSLLDIVNTSFSNYITLVEGGWLNFSKKSPILNINLVEDLLFWTDNRNQPRKINVKTAFEKGNNYYTTEDHISVAKYAPVASIGFINGNISTMKNVVSPLNPDGTANPNYNAGFIGDQTFLQDKFVRFSYRYKYDDNEYSILAPFSQIAFVPQQDGSFMGTSTDLENDENTAFRSSVVEFMQNKINQIGLVIIFDSLRTNLFNDFKIKEIEIIYKESNSTTCYILDTIKTSSITYDINNLYKYIYTYESRKPKGTLPEDQLVRVYDKIPVRALTQETAGGRIIYGNYVDKHTPPLTIDYRVTINKKSDTLQKEFPLHNVKSNRNYQVGIVLSDRYGRQSDVILSPVDPTDLLNGGGRASSFYAPWYNPTLDSSEITGGVLNFFGNCISVVFDTPILQSTQDVRNPISNVDRNSTGTPGLYSPPSFALTAIMAFPGANYGPGPMLRNFLVYDNYDLYDPYTLGKVVFEIQAIMSNPSSGVYTISSITVIKSFATVFVDEYYYYIINPILDPDDNRMIVSVKSVSMPNPTGWYSYKIVVKQQQQEYYNVYAAGALAGYPTATGSTAPIYPTGEESKTSNLILFSDNINKIPRDLSLVGPEQRQFRSSVQLFGRVQNLDINNSYNQQFYPSTKGFSVPNIQAILDIAHITDQAHYYQLQNGSIIARTNNNNVKFGATHNHLIPKLCILETDPFVSNLDLYWETSTTGLISDLNASISASNNPGVVSFGDVGWEFYENQSSLGTTNVNDVTGNKLTEYVTDWFYPLDSNNNILTQATVTLPSSDSVFDLTGTVRNGVFNMTHDPILNRYRIKIITNVITSENTLRNQFILSLNTSVLINSVVVTSYINIQGSLTNVNPIIYIPGQTFQGAPGNTPVVMPPIVAYRGIIDIYQFKGENGAAYLFPTDYAPKQQGLVWSFQDGTSTFNEGTGTTAVSLNLSTGGFLKVAGGSPGIRVQPVIKLTDAGGAFSLLTVDLDFTLGEFNQGEFTSEYNI